MDATCQPNQQQAQMPQAQWPAPRRIQSAGSGIQGGPSPHVVASARPDTAGAPPTAGSGTVSQQPATLRGMRPFGI